MNAKTFSYLLAIFLAGFLAGWFLMPFNKSGPSLHLMKSEVVAHRMQKKLVSKLNLSEDQLQKIAPILRETSQELVLVQEQTFKRTEEVLDTCDSKIIKLLTPMQVAKLKELRKKRQKHFQEEHGNRSNMRKQKD